VKVKNGTEIKGLQLLLNRPSNQKRRSREAVPKACSAKAQSGAGLMNSSILPVPMTSFRRVKIRVRLERRVASLRRTDVVSINFKGYCLPRKP
jgi:hypothetical protein